MLLSILIPTRKRPEKLARAIASILACGGWGDAEVLLGFDDDDPGRLAERPLGCWTYSWPRDDQGYELLHEYYTRLAEKAKGDWILIFNDDALLKGTFEELRRIPLSGFIVHPTWHSLGASKYRTMLSSPFPIVPNRSWGDDAIPKPVDLGLDARLRIEKNWQVRLLDGLTIEHNRTSDDTLPASRF